MPPRLLALPALLAAALLAWIAPAGAAQPGNPMAGAPFFVDPANPAAQAASAALDAGDVAAARALGRIGSVAQSQWFTAPDDPLDSGYVADFFDRWRSTAPGSIAVITLHGLPNQVCAGENRPGLGSVQDYRDWIDRWTQRIGDQRVVVVVEPDALAASSCLAPIPRRERYGMIAYAARRLSALPHTGVYIDAGAGDWLPAREAARLLRVSGVRWARGFSLNVTHYDWTSAEVRYGNRVGRMLGGKHFIVNTAFNGRGPETRGTYHLWCNPHGRALGPRPTTRTGSRLADAFFWVSPPGLSDGHCNGGPTVGTFWRRWALELAQNAASAPDFPVLGAHKR